MLESLAVVTKVTLEIALAVVVFRLVTERLGVSKFSFITFGLVGSFLFGALTIYKFDFFNDREIFDAVVGLLASVTIIILSYLSYKGLAQDKLGLLKAKKIAVLVLSVSVTVITLSKTLELIIYISNIFIMSTVINSELILKTSGSLIGILISFLLVIILLRIKGWVTNKVLLVSVFSLASISVMRYMITIFQTLFATGMLPLKPWVLAILSPLINTYYPMLFYVILALLIIAWLLIKANLKQNKPDTTKIINTAVKRKFISRFLKEKRWVAALGLTLAGIAIVLSTNAVMANRKVDIDPPVPATANDGIIAIPLSEIADYNMHRFAYNTSNNVKVRFIVIKKGESSYGTGLDACDICGEAGYYQRGKEVICKNCDVIINIPTIGFPGGCNPIPIKAEVNGDKLLINTSQLEEHESKFSQ